MTLSELLKMRIEVHNQKDPENVAGVKIDLQAGQAFGNYVQNQTAYSVPRIGILFGRPSDEDDSVEVHAIFEPAQSCVDGKLVLLNESELERFTHLVSAFKLSCVGVIISHTSDCKVEATAHELSLAASRQPSPSSPFALLLLHATPEGPKVEAYELSQDFVRLYERKLIITDEEVAKRPISKWEKREKGVQFVQFADEIYFDLDYRWSLPVECFLVPISLVFIKTAFETRFPIENRVLHPTPTDLREHLEAFNDRSFASRLRDYHLLFYLSSTIGLETVLEMSERILQDGPIEEGHQLLINMLAES